MTINGRHRAPGQVSNYDSELVDSDDNSYSACIECNCMTSCQEESVCDNCNYINYPNENVHFMRIN